MNLSEVLTDEQRAIEARCLAALARREHSRVELAAKLHEFSPQAIASVLDTLAERGWQSDLRFAESYVRSHVSRGQGRLKIRHELEMRGIRGELLRDVLDSTDWYAVAHETYHKKYATPAQTQQERAKRQRFMVQRGFTFDEIQQAMKATHNET
ncbi:MAG: regulatory protein RecX [Cardiobacteriaceae bacterium]|nr:regulatory protein RecX [Cardiobacteriaceae bacterium]